MRKEADDIGPTAELEHWKERMAKFNVYVILTQMMLDIIRIYYHIKWHLLFWMSALYLLWNLKAMHSLNVMEGMF